MQKTLNDEALHLAEQLKQLPDLSLLEKGFLNSLTNAANGRAEKISEEIAAHGG